MERTDKSVSRNIERRKMAKYWFRARKGLKSKDFGWGYIPISWEGVAAYIVLIGLLILAAVYFNVIHATFTQGILFLVAIIVLLIIFALIAKSKTQK